MLVGKALSERLGKFILRLGLFRGVVVITGASIIGSVLVTMVVVYLLSGRLNWFALIIAAVVPGVIGPFFSYVLLNQLHELERARENMSTLAITDDLTGAFNRRHFMKLSEQELGRARRYQRALSVILFDADDFKTVNDTYGHLCGDLVLTTISKTCQGKIRDQDVLARYGGDEFILLLPETDSTDARLLAERICRTIEVCQIICEQHAAHVTVSVGVTTLSQESLTINTLISQADQALYRAKQAGKNCVMVM